MIGPVSPTPYDLAFSVFGIPVRVIPTFWLLSGLLGWSYMQRGPEYLFTWIGVVFVSILLHELGHAVTALSFGYPPRVFLYHFGGLAMYEPYRDYTTTRSILISLAGPFAGFALLAVTFVFSWGMSAARVEVTPLVAEALRMLVWVNLYWGLLNLLPILPLDGGQICRDVCISISPRRGERVGIWISVVTAVLAGIGGFLIGDRYLGFFFLLFAMQSFQSLQQRW